MALSPSLPNGTKESPLKVLKGVSRSSVSSQIIEDTLKKLEISRLDLSILIGISDSGLRNYIRDGICPTYIGLACEGLLMQSGSKPDAKQRFFLLTEYKGTFSIEPLSNLTEMTLSGNNFYLVPIR